MILLQFREPGVAMNQINAFYAEMTATLSRAIVAAIVGVLLLTAGVAVFML